VIRVIDWNISYQGSANSKVELLKVIINELKGKYPCVVALQEVTENTYSLIETAGLFNRHAYSLYYRKPGKFEGNNRGLGCLIGITEGAELTASSLIDRVLFPERALCATVRLQDLTFEVISFHALTGIAFKKGKSAQFAALADYLYHSKGKPLILCCDLNEPEIDHHDLNNVECFDQLGDKGKFASYILKPAGIHDLQDAFRLWLIDNHEEYHGIREVQSEEEKLEVLPLAVSHILVSGKKKRYDYIMVSPHFKVSSITYRFDDAIRAGSDHAVVVADLDWKGN
jgi:endonuclease/exonuclease/phosphatase family metal-dependent hydrolase